MISRLLRFSNLLENHWGKLRMATPVANITWITMKSDVDFLGIFWFIESVVNKWCKLTSCQVQPGWGGWRCRDPLCWPKCVHGTCLGRKGGVGGVSSQISEGEDSLFPGTPLKMNMEQKNTQLKRKIIFQTSITMFHVNFYRCSVFKDFFPSKRENAPNRRAFPISTGGGSTIH